MTWGHQRNSDKCLARFKQDFLEKDSVQKTVDKRTQEQIFFKDDIANLVLPQKNDGVTHGHQSLNHSSGKLSATSVISELASTSVNQLKRASDGRDNH